MKNRIFNFGLCAMLVACLTSCEAIGDIFQAGMGVGIFLVVAVVVIIIWIISRFRK
jgi:flagellar biogenesis protein FliO